jgi:hypothetical protein
MSNSISSSRDQAGLVTHRRTVSVHTDLSSLTQRIADESTTPTAHDSPHSSNSSTSVTISTGLPRLKHPAPAPHAVTRVLKRLTLVWQPLLAGALLIAGCLLWLCISLKSEYEAAQREEWSPASWGNPWAGQPGTDGKSGGAHTMSWHQFADHNKAVLRASFAHLVDTALTKPAKAPGGAAGGLPAGPYDGARIHGSRAGASTGPLELQPISQSDSTGIDSQGAGLRHSSHKPVRLKYPVLWAGPFFTRSGGCLLDMPVSLHRSQGLPAIIAASMMAVELATLCASCVARGPCVNIQACMSHMCQGPYDQVEAPGHVHICIPSVGTFQPLPGA